MNVDEIRKRFRPLDPTAYPELRGYPRDAIYEGFDHYIRGTKVRRNPFDASLWELPDQTRRTWFGENGSILFTDDVNYDPNSDINRQGSWRQVQ